MTKKVCRNVASSFPYLFVDSPVTLLKNMCRPLVRVQSSKGVFLQIHQNNVNSSFFDVNWTFNATFGANR